MDEVLKEDAMSNSPVIKLQWVNRITERICPSQTSPFIFLDLAVKQLPYFRKKWRIFPENTSSSCEIVLWLILFRRSPIKGPMGSFANPEVLQKEEVIAAILKHLSLADVASCALVCKVGVRDCSILTWSVSVCLYLYYLKMWLRNKCWSACSKYC